MAQKMTLSDLEPAEQVIQRLAASGESSLLSAIARRAAEAIWQMNTEKSRRHLNSITDAALSLERMRPASGEAE